MVLNLVQRDDKSKMVTFFMREDVSCNTFVDPDDIDVLIFDEHADIEVMSRIVERNKSVSLFALLDEHFFDINSDTLSLYQQEALKEKKYWIVKRINRIKNKVNIISQKSYFDSYPSILQVESTSLCNAKCIMCSHYYKDIREGVHLSFDHSKMLSEVLPYIETVMLHGIGEPFLNPDIDKWLDFYKHYGVHLSTFTNMSILTPTLQEVIGRSFSALHISCDGCTRKTFEHIRRNLKYSTFVNNVKKLHEAYPNLKLHMHTVAMRQNLHELTAFVKFAAELGFSSVIFSNLSINPLINNGGDSLRCFPTMAKRAFAEIEREAAERGLIIEYPMEYRDYPDDEILYRQEKSVYDSLPLFRDDKEVLARVNKQEPLDLYSVEELQQSDIHTTHYRCRGLCDWLSERAYYDLNGNLAVCCSKYYITMGNISNYNSFHALWNSPQFIAMRDCFFQSKLPSLCQGCRYIIDNGSNHVVLENYDEDFLKIQTVGTIYKKFSC